MKLSSHHPQYYQRQSGALLVVSILFLVVLTMISLSSITSTVLQEKTTANTFNAQLAFQASETGLRSAEEYIRELSERPVAQKTCTGDCNQIWEADALGNLYGGGGFQSRWWATANTQTNDSWWSTVAHSMPTVSTPSGTPAPDSVSYVAAQPRFIAEEVAFIPDDLSPNTRAAGAGLTFYRLTARGTGAEQEFGGINPAKVTLQSIFSKRFH